MTNQRLTRPSRRRQNLSTSARGSIDGSYRLALPLAWERALFYGDAYVRDRRCFADRALERIRTGGNAEAA